MPYSAGHAYITWGGSSFGDNETWQFGLRTNQFVAQQTFDHIQAIAEAAYGIIGPSTSGCSTAVKLLWCKIVDVDVNGSYPDNGRVRVYEVPGGVAGQVSGDTIPQASIVVSLTTDSSRGYAHAGRFYLPTTGWGASVADGLLAVGQRDTLLTNARTFLRAVNAQLNPAGNTGGEEYIAVHSKVGAGAMKRVTGVRVGRVIDTRRSRRSSLPEMYAGLAL